METFEETFWTDLQREYHLLAREVEDHTNVVQEAPGVSEVHLQMHSQAFRCYGVYSFDHNNKLHLMGQAQDNRKPCKVDAIYVHENKKIIINNRVRGFADNPTSTREMEFSALEQEAIQALSILPATLREQLQSVLE